jgi:hypothetical protein
MSVEKPIDIITVDASPDGAKNKFLEKVRNKLEGELTHTSVEKMVDGVLAKLKKGECIGKLEIVGHGNNGLLIVGARRSGNVAGKRINGGKDEWDDQLLRLKGKFCEKGKIVLAGCSVGVCDKGAEKMLELANLLNVKVCAASKTIYPSDFGKNGYKSETTEVSPGDKAGCRKQEDPKRVKKLKKLKDDGFRYIAPEKIKALGLKLSGAELSHASVLPIRETEVIQSLFEYVDFSTAYNGNDLSSVIDVELSVSFNEYVNDSWAVILGYEAIEIVRNNNFLLFEITNSEAFKCQIEWLMNIQSNTDALYRDMFGFNTQRPSSSQGQPLKEFRALVLAKIDKPYRSLSGQELLNSPLSVIKGIGPVTEQQLMEALNINTVADLAAINVDSRWTKIARNIETLAQMEAESK